MKTFVMDPSFVGLKYPKGSLYTGPKLAFGERECIHSKLLWNVSSARTLGGNTVSLSPSYQISADQLARFKAGSKYFLCIGPGEDRYKMTEWVNKDLSWNHTIEYNSNGVDFATYRKFSVKVYNFDGYDPVKSMSVEEEWNFVTGIYTSVTKYYDSSHELTHEASSSTSFRKSTISAELATLPTTTEAYLEKRALSLAVPVFSALRKSVNSWAHITENAVYNAHPIDFNTGLFLKELPELPGSIDNLIKGIGNLGSLAGAADQYLNYQYGLAQTIKEVDGLITTIDQHRADYAYNRTSYGSARHALFFEGREGNIERHVKIWYTNNSKYVSDFYLLLKKFGLTLGPTNVVDAIPFSFVLNWVTNLEDVLHNIEAHLTLDAIEPKGCLSSEKMVTAVLTQEIYPQLVGTVRVSKYHRYWKPKLHALKWKGLALESPNQMNLVNGGALILQKLK